MSKKSELSSSDEVSSVLTSKSLNDIEVNSPGSSQTRYDLSLSTMTTLPELSKGRLTLENHDAWPDCLFTSTDSFLVMMKSDEEGVTPKQRDQHVQDIQRLCNQKKNSGIGIQVGLKDLENLFPAYMGVFPADILAEIKSSKVVKSACINSYIETELLSPCDWSHSRNTLPPAEYAPLLSQNDDPNGGTVNWWSMYPSTGGGVHVYIVDSGGFDDSQTSDFTQDRARIRTVEFKSQPKNHYKGKRIDPNKSHGTRMANLAVGDSLGVAPKAFVYPLCNGAQTEDAADASNTNYYIACFNAIIGNHKKGGPADGQTGIVNCSWNRKPGAGHDFPAILAMRKLVEAGLIVNLAAGNSSLPWTEKHETLPLRPLHSASEHVNLVASIDKHGNIPIHPNYGKRVTIFAPGQRICSVKGDDKLPREKRRNGTSSATAITTGYLASAIGAGLIETKPTPEEVQRFMKSLALVTDLYQFKDGGKTLTLPLETLGPPGMANDLVILPLSLLTERPWKKVDQKSVSQGWATAETDQWSIRGRSDDGENTTRVITRVQLESLVKCLEENWRDMLKRLWTETFGLRWELMERHRTVHVGTKSLSLGNDGFTRGKWLEVAEFIEKNMIEERKKKPIGNCADLPM